MLIFEYHAVSRLYPDGGVRELADFAEQAFQLEV